MVEQRSREELEQLALGLVIEEEEIPGGAALTPAEARLRSEAARQALEARSRPALGEEGAAEDWSGPTWLDEYHQLLDAGWPWRVAAYIAWAASPRQGRWPETQERLATETLGLTSDRAISTWRKKNPAIDEVIAVMQAAPLFRHRRDIYEALIRSATSPDYKSHQDRKLALEILGDYRPSVDVQMRQKARDLSQLSDDELDALARQVLRSGNEGGEKGSVG